MVSKILIIKSEQVINHGLIFGHRENVSANFCVGKVNTDNCVPMLKIWSQTMADSSKIIRV